MTLIENPSAHTLAQRRWRASHVEHRRAWEVGYNRDYRARLKAETFDRYGGAVCVCCGEQGLAFLSIDHIHGDGLAHRERIGGGGTSLYRWLRKNDYPEGFQVLCHNCNQAKSGRGTCPHWGRGK